MVGTLSALMGVIGLLSLGWGIWTEFRQTRETGPVAIVPTLPQGVGAALLLTMATALYCGRELPLAASLALLPVLTIACCAAINLAGHRSG
ncbi:MAG: hypothetical protein HOW73_09460 [Polyangiaceae bacterium]|nr:hypothetical protein [Polyangiaceae bacterium]